VGSASARARSRRKNRSPLVTGAAQRQRSDYCNIPRSRIAIRRTAKAASATKHSAYPDTTVRSNAGLVSGLDSVLCVSPKIRVSDSKLALFPETPLRMLSAGVRASYERVQIGTSCVFLGYVHAGRTSRNAPFGGRCTRSSVRPKSRSTRRTPVFPETRPDGAYAPDRRHACEARDRSCEAVLRLRTTRRLQDSLEFGVQPRPTCEN